MSSNRWRFEDLHTYITVITHVLRYKKVLNTNQYNGKATRLAAYNAHKGDEAETEDLDHRRVYVRLRGLRVSLYVYT